MSKTNKPIGILDSGIGGLSIYQELVLQLPHESIVYVGDHAHIPYGSKSEGEIYDLSKRLVAFLIKHDVKAIIVACNTITVSALDTLRAKFPDMPIIGTVPVVKTAATVTRNKRIGILSTTRTAQSAYQERLIAEFAQHCEVANIGTDALVPLIEEGDVDGEAFAKAVRDVVQPFQEAGTDTIALGCTHYPLVRKQLQEALGDDVLLLDSSAAIARQVRRVLQNNTALAEEQTPTHRFFTTGSSAQFDSIAKKLLGATIASETVQV